MPPRTKSSASIDPYLGRKLGNVRLTAKLGQGGMGLVYRGWHEGFRQEVAVKILPDRTHQGAQLERFIREGRAAAAIQHPNVVRVMDAGNEDGTSYLVLELVDGSSLGDILDAGAARTRVVNAAIHRPGQSHVAPGPREGLERARGR